MSKLSWGQSRRAAKASEQLPWYRAPGYKGNLTEAEKRRLDAFRMRTPHPAARMEDLPEEVQTYIGGLELAIYDFKQGEAATRAFAGSALGAAMVGLNYFGVRQTGVGWVYVFGLLLLIVPWFFYSREWHKNAEEFLPEGESRRTDELIKKEWELEYIVGHKGSVDD